MRKVTRWVVGLVSTLSMVVALSVPAAAGSAAVRSAAPTGAPIQVGVICSCSGPFGSFIDGAAKVADAWAKSVNDSGGIAGHPVSITTVDDASSPGTSVTRAQQLISSNVDVILDLTNLDATWQNAVQSANIPVVGGAINNQTFFQNPDFYPAGQTQDTLDVATVLTAKKAGAKNFGQLYCAEAPICQESVAPLKAAGQKQHVPDVYSASIAATAPNYTAQCVAADQAGVKALFIGQAASVVTRVASDCERQGYKPVYITQGSGYSNAVASTAGLKDRLWSPYAVLPFFAKNPAVQKMNKAVDKYEPGLRKDDNAWSELGAQAWTGGLLIQKAATASGMTPSDTPSAAMITKGLNSIKGETLDGWSPPLTFTAGQPHSVDCWYTARVANGKPSVAGGGKLTCSRPS